MKLEGWLWLVAAIDDGTAVYVSTPGTWEGGAELSAWLTELVPLDDVPSYVWWSGRSKQRVRITVEVLDD